ncbi:MAG TPA: hypothetical protein VGC40_01795 [Paenirhodobacter sp.]
MTAESTPAAPPAAPRPARARSKAAPKAASKAVPQDPATMSPADLVAGPCALPDAALDMPQQVIEPAKGLLRRMIDALGLAPNSSAVSSAGTGQ